MRVCIVTSAPIPPEEGVGYHVWNLACQLRERGHEVGIITRGRLARTIEEVLEGVTVWRAPFIPVYPFHVHFHSFFVNRLLNRIEDRFDLINAHTPLPPAVNTSLPLVTTVHSPMRADTSATTVSDLHTLTIWLQTPVSQRIESALFRRSTKITAVASWVPKAMASYEVDPKQVSLTGNGVERCFLSVPLNRKTKPYILYAGRLAVGKGLEDLIEAAKTVFQEYQDDNLQFMLVGGGSLLPKLKEMVYQAGLQSRFVFRGNIGIDRRQELVRIYQDALMFVLPSHHEGMPTVLLEAMAAGLPAVSTAVGGALELIVHGENGFLVPAKDPKRFAHAMLTLLNNPGKRGQVGQKARETVQRHYSWDAVCERYLESYHQVLNGHG